MPRFWPSRPDGLDTDSPSWPGRKGRATTAEMTWRLLDRSSRLRFVLSGVISGVLSVFIVGAFPGLFDQPPQSDDPSGWAWFPAWPVVMLALSYVARVRVIAIAAELDRRQASSDQADDAVAPAEQGQVFVSQRGQEPPLPAGAHVMDYRSGSEFWSLLLGSLAAGALAAPLLPDGGAAGTVAVDALLIAAGLFLIGLGVGLAAGRMTINDGLVWDAFSSRGQAAFYRTIVPLFVGTGVGASLYFVVRRGWIGEDQASDVLASALLVLLPLSATLFFFGWPRILVPHFLRALGAPRTVWDAVPDPPYDRKGRKRRPATRPKR